MAGERFDLDPSIRVLLRDLRISPARVLRRAALPADLFARRSSELAVTDYYRFWDTIQTEAESAGHDHDHDRDGDHDLAVAIGKAISVEHFSPPIFAALCSPDLRTAAHRLARYKPLIGPVQLGIDTRKTNTTEEVTISYRWPPGPPPPRLLATVELVFWVALSRIATREHIRPTCVTTPAPPHDRGPLERFLGSRVQEGPTYSVTFAGLDATRPFLTENEHMWHVFAPSLRRRLADLQASATVAERVRAALLETLPAGDPSITAVTGQLATSQRTLQRQLSQEGTSFQAVLASTRESLARHYLTRDDLRTPEIAFLLGYADTNSFYRAFKTWTGTTPERARDTA